MGGQVPHDVFLPSLLAGGVAGTTVDVALYPIDTIKTRLQFKDGFRAAGGFNGVYRGLSAALMAAAPCAAAFFASYEVMKKTLTPSLGSMSPLVPMAAACTGEAVAAVIRVPFEIAKQEMMVTAATGNGARASPFAVLRRVVAARGVGVLVHGYFSLVAREIPFSFLQMPMYEFFKRQMALRLHKQVKELSGFEAAMCGSLSGGIAAGLTTPLDVAKTRVMTNKSTMNPYQMIKEIYTTEGAAALYRGVVPRVIWISVGGAIFFGAYEHSRKWFISCL